MVEPDLSQSGVRPSLLSDNAASEDLMATNGECGAHSRIADAIAKVVQSESQAGVIGIEGGWGSGKTTVVNLLEKRLTADSALDDRIRLFRFDAWCHEGDPLRRAFLDELIGFLASWLPSREKLKEWEARRESLGKALVDQDTTTKPQIRHHHAGLALLVLAALPVIGAGLMAGVSANLSLTPGRPSGMFILGLCLALAAPMYLLLRHPSWLLGVCSRFRKTQKSPRDSRHRTDHGTLPGVVVGQLESSIKTKSRETPLATSLEFERCFNDLMDDTLVNSRRLVVVLDNLDRIERDSALRLLSHLQVFLPGRRSEENLPWASYLWVVLPYDRDGLARIWANAEPADAIKIGNGRRTPDAKGSEPQMDTSDASVTEMRFLGYKTASSYLDKVLQVRFHLPPPALQYWRGFFASQARKALPGQDSSVYEDIRWTFTRCCVSKGSAPTPRAIKLYLNQLAALVIQWEDEPAYTIQVLGYYAGLLRSKAPHIRKQLWDGSLPDTWFVGEGDQESVRKQLSGLAYGVAPAEGYHLLLAETLEEAVLSADKNSLVGAHAVHGEAVWEVLDHTCQFALHALDPPELLAAIDAIASIPTENREHKSLARTAGKAIRGAGPWSAANEKLVDQLLTAIGFCDSRPTTESVIANYQRTLDRIPPLVKEEDADVDNPVLPKALVATRKLVERLQEPELDVQLERPFAIQMRYQAWVGASQKLKGATDKALLGVAPEIAEGSMTESLMQSIASAGFGNAHRDCILITSRTSANVKWGNVASSALARLDASTEPAPVDEAVRIIETLEGLSSVGCDSAAESLDSFAASGSPLHYLYHASENKKDAAVAKLMFFHLRANPSGAKPDPAGNSEEGHSRLEQYMASGDRAIVGHLLEIISPRSELTILRDVIEQRDAMPALVQQMIAQLTRADDIRAVLTPASFIRDWRSLRSGLPAEDGEDEETANVYQRALLAVCEADSFDRYLSSGDAALAKLGDADLLLELLEVTQTSSVLTWCKNGVESASKPEWKACFMKLPAGLRLVGKLDELGVRLQLGSSVREAILELSKDLAAGKSPSQESMDMLRSLVSLMSGPVQSVLGTRILKGALSPAEGIGDPFFEHLGFLLPEAQSLATLNDLIPKLFEPLLAHENVAGLSWLATRMEEGYKLRETDQPASTDSFKREVVSLIPKQETGSDMEAVLVRLAAALGVSLPAEPEEAEDKTAE